MSVKDSAWKLLDTWCAGLNRWRGPIDVVWLLYLAAYVCVGRNGIDAVAGPIGVTAVVAPALFVSLVLPFLPRKGASV